MVLYGAGLRIDQFLSEAAISVAADPAPGHDVLRLLAALMARSARGILERHVVQKYVVNESRVRSLRGSVRWDRDFARPPALGVACRYYEKRTDNLLNRLIVAGLDRGLSYSSTSGFAPTEVQTQNFIWRELAELTAPDFHQFETALSSLDRLSDHYKQALLLSRLLVQGWGPGGLYSGEGAQLQAMWFDLPAVFERVLERALVESYPVASGKLRFQQTHRTVLMNGQGESYRNIQPDIILYSGDAPALIIDAKFKPQYVQARNLAGTPESLVLSADIYQLYFYSQRLSLKHGLKESVPACIVAPTIVQDSKSIAVKWQTVRWSEYDTENPTISLNLFSIDLPRLLLGAQRGEHPRLLFREAAPDLASVVELALGEE